MCCVQMCYLVTMEQYLHMVKPQVERPTPWRFATKILSDVKYKQPLFIITNTNRYLVWAVVLSC